MAEIIFKEIQFLGSFPTLKQCPGHTFGEYAFIGRSNVGKSTLINYLSGQSGLAKTSKKPGKTQLINIFLLDKTWCMVDLPGYGYAVSSKEMRKSWKKLIYDYLEFRENLINTFVLLDSRLPLQTIDLEFINWLGSKRIPFSLIYTKTDGIAKTKQQGNIDRIREELLKHWDELPAEFVSSSVDKRGREEILQYIIDINNSL